MFMSLVGPCKYRNRMLYMISFLILITIQYSAFRSSYRTRQTFTFSLYKMHIANSAVVSLAQSSTGKSPHPLSSILNHNKKTPSSRFGFSPAISQLLTVPPYVFACMPVPHSLPISSFYLISTALIGLLAALLSDRWKVRSPFVLAGHAMCILGFGIQISDAGFGVKYFGTFFCVAGGYGMFPALPSW